MATPIQTSLNFSTVISRQEAIAKGLKRYFTGVACVNGHVSERLVSSTNCLGCSYARTRQYYAENREELCAKQREYNRTRNVPNKERDLRRKLNAAKWSGERQQQHRVRTAANMKALRLNRRLEKAGRPKPTHCEVCKQKARKICYDHCHKTGAFRGWLCEHCNFAVGHAKDSAERLMQLAEYLKAYEAAQQQQAAAQVAQQGNNGDGGAEAQA